MQGKTFLWALKLPRTIVAAAGVGPRPGSRLLSKRKTRWTRIDSDMDLKCYRIFHPRDKFDLPDWSKTPPLLDLMRRAFGDGYLIKDGNHPLVRRIRGVGQVAMLDRLPFARIVCCDTEYVARPGERVLPVCLVAKELRSGQVVRRWMGGFGERPPYPLDKRTLFVSFSVPAELSVHRALGWRDPARVLDLFAEHRLNVNGRPYYQGLWGLHGAMIEHGLDPGRPPSKTRCASGSSPARRSRTMSGAEILAYCERDVDGLAQLLERMLPRILRRPNGLVHALNRGSYGVAVAAMEATGVPIDAPLLHRLREHWEPIKDQLAIDVDHDYGVFNGHELDRKRFAEFIKTARHSLATHAQNGRPVHRQRHVQGHGPGQAPPAAQPAPRSTVHSRTDAPERSSGGCRWPQPVRAQTVLGDHRTQSTEQLRLRIRQRHLVSRTDQPPPGRAIIYADWRCQEIGIEAANSQDPAMLEDLLADDFYIAFGKRARVLPDDATRETHEAERERAQNRSPGRRLWHAGTIARRAPGQDLPGSPRAVAAAPAHLPPVLAMER